jgi:hypothetical protein
MSTKTSPEALRRHADFIEKHDDPDTTTALRWAADTIEQQAAEIARLQRVLRMVLQLADLASPIMAAEIRKVLRIPPVG